MEERRFSVEINGLREIEKRVSHGIRTYRSKFIILGVQATALKDSIYRLRLVRKPRI